MYNLESAATESSKFARIKPSRVQLFAITVGDLRRSRHAWEV